LKALPVQFDRYFTEVNNIYTKKTRATDQKNYFIPFAMTSKLQKSIKYQGPLIWNSLNQNISSA